jgi:predicted SprT family Zn-dependent metalloprotease
MNTWDALALARAHLEDNDLHAWRVELNPRLKRALGRCTYAPRRLIELSTAYVEQNAESEVEQTILHEIAHALAGHAAGHGLAWQAHALRLGVHAPNAINRTATVHVPWALRCDVCGSIIKRAFRRTNKAEHYHRKCGVASTGRLTWIENPEVNDA